MKFTLTYEGPLPASANRSKVAARTDIALHIHRQLVDLWDNHPALRTIEKYRIFPRTGGMSLWMSHHQSGGDPQRPHIRPGDELDLCETINKHGLAFRPLVRESYALHCGLKVLFLRKEGPGHVYSHGGDLDGRVKTLLDALTMPQQANQIDKHQCFPSPLFCLLEDDSFVSGLQVETDRLLAGEDCPTDYAKLVIEVEVRVREATVYNQSFLG